MYFYPNHITMKFLLLAVVSLLFINVNDQFDEKVYICKGPPSRNTI